MKKIKNLSLLTGIILLMFFASCGKTYKYENIPNDPMDVRIYTLDNGLKVYMSVYKDAPRIQTYIGVRVGSKNDPAETTGLAHYFEHLMFKGTSSFGTKDYAAEKPLLDEIEAMFEKYRSIADETERRIVYRQIDSLSQLAAAYAIPSEYDKLMALIGAEGTNAYTSFDQTVYVENIPSNEIENWAKIEYERFTNPVIRLFHTELETVYEEYNMYMDDDDSRANDTLFAALFPHHTYGTQTTIGVREHLKNPSIINIKNFFNTYYVPNNMAIVLSGDFDPDSTIKIIDKYFGKMERKDLPAYKPAVVETRITPVEKEVVGPNAAYVYLGWNTPAATSRETDVAEIVSSMLYNGKAGLIDLNLNQKQKVLESWAYMMPLTDAGVFITSATPVENQTLEETKTLLLEQVDLLKKGEFPDWILEATINNYKMNEIRKLESNYSRGYTMLSAFVDGVDWKTASTQLDRQEKITKQEVVDFANKYLTDGYVVVYKREGENPDDKKIEKPEITPININRDDESNFMAQIKLEKAPAIEPVFLDYDKDLSKLKAQSNIEILYKQNEENDLFRMYYVFDMGTDNDRALGMAFDYLNYLGTSKLTPEEVQSEFYKLASTFYVWSSSDRVYVMLFGLNENMEASITLLEELLKDAQPNPEALKNMVSDIQKSRADDKLNHYAISSALNTYAMWGPKSSFTNILSTKELKEITPENLLDRLRSLNSYEHYIMYYGPKTSDEFLTDMAKLHHTPETLQPVPPATKFEQQTTDKNTVLFAPFKSKQLMLTMLSKGIPYDASLTPIKNMYENYFGGDMSSIVFQEMREARGLCYYAGAYYMTPSKPDRSYYLMARIGTQTDKMNEAVHTFWDILNNMPESENTFKLAQESTLTRIRTERITKVDILWDYAYAKRMNIDHDIRKDIFEQVPSMTLADVKQFQEKYIKGKTYTYCIVGDPADVDFKAAQTYGPVKKVTLEEIFGY